MKILQVIPYFCFGGAETMCENLTYGLLELGHAVTVVSLYAQNSQLVSHAETSRDQKDNSRFTTVFLQNYFPEQ